MNAALFFSHSGNETTPTVLLLNQLVQQLPHLLPRLKAEGVGLVTDRSDGPEGDIPTSSN
jgi:hypothetical protein